MSFFIDWLRQAVALTSENKHNFEKVNAGCYEKTYTTATNSQVLFNLARQKILCKRFSTNARISQL